VIGHYTLGPTPRFMPRRTIPVMFMCIWSFVLILTWWRDAAGAGHGPDEGWLRAGIRRTAERDVGLDHAHGRLAAEQCQLLRGQVNRERVDEVEDAGPRDAVARLDARQRRAQIAPRLERDDVERWRRTRRRRASTSSIHLTSRIDGVARESYSRR
jgi:hypothetical protein